MINNSCPIVHSCPTVRKYADCSKCVEEQNVFHKECLKKNAMLTSSTLDRECESQVSTIKDSGDRTQFATGAVRDMRENKGRCDLMPLHVISTYMKNIDDKKGIIVELIADFMDDPKNTTPLYMTIAHFANMAFDESCCTMFLEVAKHFEDGAKKYGENNWRKGIPYKCYIDSALRHYFKWARGDKDEPHDRAFVWNLMCCIWEVDYHKTVNKPKEK